MPDALLSDLKAVREKIANGWTQHSYAKDAHGYFINHWHRKAAAFCLSGACHRQIDCEDAAQPLFIFIRDGIRRRFGDNWTIPSWNDHKGRTKQQVLALLDELIAEREATHG